MLSENFVSAVSNWFRENRRALPWREGRDPYRIWISEVMLQQTRIEAVIPYYFRFLEEIPSVQALALCPEEKLLKLWEGLGYYSRAKNLKKAAEIIVSQWQGKIPEEASELRRLPGLGGYTAGAISAIAFGRPEPAVDGNVLRVLSRVLGDESDISKPETKKRMTAILREVYPSGKDAGDLTEGIMEIGERICIPNGAPACTVCPVKGECRAYRENLTASLPVKSVKAARKKIKMTVFLLCFENTFALRKREEKGLLAGMWEFYHTDGHLSPAAAREHLSQMGLCPQAIKKIGSHNHIFTHLEWDMRGYLVHCEKKIPELVFQTREEIERETALPTAFHPFLKKI